MDLIEYLLKIGYKTSNIFLIGRSIGTGPAINIAAVYKVGAIILLSPFTSIKEVVSHMYGELVGFLLK